MRSKRSGWHHAGVVANLLGNSLNLAVDRLSDQRVSLCGIVGHGPDGQGNLHATFVLARRATQFYTGTTEDQV